MNRNVEQWDIRKNAVESDGGVVASQNWRASAAGADTLARGGNAIDAAVSCAFALNAVEPWMCGLGGSGYIVIWLAKEKRAVAIDFQGTLPSEISTSLAAASAVPPVAIKSSIIRIESFLSIESL